MKTQQAEMISLSLLSVEGWTVAHQSGFKDTGKGAEVTDGVFEFVDLREGDFGAEFEADYGCGVGMVIMISWTGGR